MTTEEKAVAYWRGVLARLDASEKKEVYHAMRLIVRLTLGEHGKYLHTAEHIKAQTAALWDGRRRRDKNIRRLDDARSQRQTVRQLK